MTASDGAGSAKLAGISYKVEKGHKLNDILI